ncbi:molecular chaperone HtpG [Spirochaetia bacterium 38H-sp]|uniref:Chaperone protein HtpG n=1 Tax=Rarispira pelagica TaxID=3141764 RepID=A0ABU9U922_9SPIR
MAKHHFQTEVNRLLDILIYSLYSHREIFLRELVSNASDALDKLKILTLTDDAYKGLDFAPRIDISFDKDKALLTVSDTGIGMNDEDLVEHLGTIAKSGTREFLSRLSGDEKKDSELIGQFGVGFYSAFMVADRVEVISKKAGEEQAWRWVSDGKGEYEIDKAKREGHGTSIVLHLKEDAKEFASEWRIREIVKRYSNHIAFPIYLSYEDDKGNKKEEQVNSAQALWRRSKSELEHKDYVEFYKNISGDDEEPLFYLHIKAEGTMEYSSLLFVPRRAPFDMFSADYRPGIRLYVKRVFITEDDKELLPQYLRFLRGIIDSEDLPLNVSREMLQEHRILANIRNATVKRFLQECQRVAKEEPEKYLEFIRQYNKPLKEGLYSDFAHKDLLVDLVRFKSTSAAGYTSLAEYVERINNKEQKAIYYISGGDEAVLRNAPVLEAYKKKNVEVLIMDDEIDELIVPLIGKYKDYELKAVNTSKAEDEFINDEEKKKKAEEGKTVAEKIKKILGDEVKDVIASVRLEDSPACIVLDEFTPSLKMQELLKAMGQDALSDIKPILEINTEHPVIKRIEQADDELAKDMAHILLDQAILLAGQKPKDSVGFAKRLAKIMEKI